MGTTPTRTLLTTTARVGAAVTTAVLTLGVLTACGGDDDDPAVTVSPSVSPSSTPESPTPAPAPPTDGTSTPTPSPTSPSPRPTPVTTDKPTDRQTIPPQN
ncbi:hypothetical protein [Frigoribacterium sp. MEB024]|uniref:hypothetical protein n=1 Tax=Frigoribacterium sp. MEB024 TaxID=1589899 RepID=UPI0005BBE42C|nr:hypothetical protein [Frigoribacterium sp. MEB024]